MLPNKYTHCYDYNQRIKQAVESKRFRTDAMKYFGSDIMKLMMIIIFVIISNQIKLNSFEINI